MPTTLRLYYTAESSVIISNELAKKLQEYSANHPNNNNTSDVIYSWSTKWGDLYFTGEDGKEYKVEGQLYQSDCKYTDDWNFDDAEEDDEEEFLNDFKPILVEDDEKTKALAELASTGRFPCPDCEFCKKPKTWEQTKYIKGITFMNKDACLECYEKSVKEEETEEQKATELLVSKNTTQKTIRNKS